MGRRPPHEGDVRCRWDEDHGDVFVDSRCATTARESEDRIFTDVADRPRPRVRRGGASVTGAKVTLALSIVAIASVHPIRAQEPETSGTVRTAEDTSGHRWWPPMDLAVGAGFEWQFPMEQAASNGTTVELIGRPSPRTKAGIIPMGRMAIPARTTATVSGNGAGAQEFGNLRLRPLMAGLGWVQPIAPRLSLVASGVAGYSFNSVDKAETPDHASRLVLSEPVDRIDNSFAWEFGGRLWYDLHPRIYLMGGASFLSTRPTLTLVSGTQQAWKADQIRIETGVAFLVLRR